MKGTSVDPFSAVLLLLLSAALLAMGFWYLYPGARRRLLPPLRNRAVPWSAAEIFLAYLLYLIVCPLLVRALLEGVGFFDWVYGPDFHASLAGNNGVDAQQKAMTWVALWTSMLALPVEVAAILLLLGHRSDSRDPPELSVSLAYTILLFLFRVGSGTRPYQLGLTLSHACRNVFVGFLTWMAFTPGVLAVFLLAVWCWKWTKAVPEEHPLSKLGQGPMSPLGGVLIVLSATVVAPVIEELFFRGLTQQWLERRRWGGLAGLGLALLQALWMRASHFQPAWQREGISGVLLELAPALFVMALVPGWAFLHWRCCSPAAEAIYGTAAFFAASHSFAWPQPVPLFLLGLGLGLLFYRTRSLIGPIIFHGLFNAVSCVILFLSPHTPPPVEPTNGKEAISAVLVAPSPCTSTAVPGSWLPRRR
jgi:membrane protease YdiL (CAAX protease family)